MSNLIPEKRLNKNGVLTTKHVRATPKQPSGRSALPAPSTDASKATKAAKKAYKPLSRQLEQRYRVHRLPSFKSDDPLTTAEERQENAYNYSSVSFNASDVEVYDVLSATTSSGNAIHLLTKGIRSAQAARDYLEMRGASHLIADRSALMAQALERGMSSENFMEGYELLSTEERTSPHALDGAEFKLSALNGSFSSFVFERIIKGEVSYSDIKTIGITRLKPYSRLYYIEDLLARLNKGEADYTIEDLKAFVIRAAEAKTQEDAFQAACKVAEHKGLEFLQDADDFELVRREYEHFLGSYSTFKTKHPDETEATICDRIEYGVRMRKGVTESMFSGSSTEYFEAGIPLDIAIDTINGGGGIREARAIHEDGIQSTVAGGWL